MHRTAQDQLRHFLNDMYSVEVQALAQLVSAPDAAGEAGIADDFRRHHAETQRQAERVRHRLEELGDSPSAVKDAVMKLGGKAFLLFARMQLHTPGRLLAHAYAYEAMEWAGYAVLRGLAEQAHDVVTAELARDIQAEEKAMMQRLERRFESVEAVSHARAGITEGPALIRKHLAEVHALECQSVQLLKKAVDIAGDDTLAQVYHQHLPETEAQAARVEQRLQELGTGPSLIQDTAMKLGGLNWGLFFQSQSDTPSKLTAFAYAVEHLEIAAYELLRRTAMRGGDSETARLCADILVQERAMTERLADSIEDSVRATLDAVA